MLPPELKNHFLKNRQQKDSALKKGYPYFIILEKIVITHHVPTFLNYPEQYKNSEINEAFAVELFYLIEKTKPDCWIYGHHHFNAPDFLIGETQMRTNQVGYVRDGEHRSFDNGKVISL